MPQKGVFPLDIVTYPIIVEEFHDDGHYYVATSPNIKGMVTQGKTMLELAQNAQDAIAGWISAQHPYPPVQNPNNWQLTAHQQIMWIMVDMDAWRKTIEKDNMSQAMDDAVTTLINAVGKDNIRDTTTDEELAKFIDEGEDWEK